MVASHFRLPRGHGPTLSGSVAPRDRAHLTHPATPRAPSHPCGQASHNDTARPSSRRSAEEANLPTTQVARNFPRSVFESPRNRCNSNDMNSNVEIVRRELRATLLGNHSWSLTKSAWLQCPWAAAGPGRASRRRAERSSQRGRRAGGQATRRPEICRGHKQTSRKAAAHRHTQRPGPSRQATRAAGNQAGHSNAGNQAGPQSAPPQRAERNPYIPRNVLIAGISRTAWIRPAR